MGPEGPSLDATAPKTSAGRRLAVIDAVRGGALIAMFVYHFSWDLYSQGVIDIDVGFNPFWRLFAHAIASTFLGLVGVSLVLAARHGFRPKSYLRRLAMIAGAASLLSLVTWVAAGYLFFPELFVYFGILHAIAAASVVGLLVLRLPSFAIAIAAVLILAAPGFLRSPFFDEPYWWWLGLSTVVAPTVDYVPVLPWTAATLVGLLVGRLLVAREDMPVLRWQPASRAGRVLTVMGRWSLVIYFVHQPVLLVLATLIATATGAGGMRF